MCPRIQSTTKASVVSFVLAAALLAAPSMARAEVTLREMVPMSDGTRLDTLVLLPDATGTYPTILLRTPYDDHDFQSQLGMAVGFGFAVVIQYTRGSGGSDGTAQVFRTDREDGHEALDWILAQPWSDGRIAMGGLSAIAIPAYLIAPGADPRLQCQMLAIATSDVYADTAFNGGVFRQRDVKAWLGWVGGNDWLSNLESHRLCDSWWDPIRLAPSEGADVRTASIHLGGWYDVFTQGTINGYKLWRTSSDPDIANRQYLVMGPADHFHPAGNVAGPRTFPDDAAMDIISTMLSFLQWCFDGYNDVIDAWPRVQYYLMGSDEPGAPGNEWRGAPDWPIPAEETRLYLAKDGTLGFLTPAEDGLVDVLLDPANPSPTIGGRNLVGSLGAEEQAGVEAKPDARIFTSEPLSEPLEVVGRLYATLRVMSQGTDADVAVRVTDVYPDGRSILITDGIQRISMRNGCAEKAAVTPGEPVDVDVDLWSTAYVFAPGHRVRVIVTASNHPRFELNPDLRDLPAGTAFTLDLPIVGASMLRLPVPLPDEPTPEVVEAAELPDVAEGVGETGSDVVEVVEVVEPDAPPVDAVVDTVDPVDAAPDTAEPPDVPQGTDCPGRDDGQTDADPGLGTDAVAADLPTGDVGTPSTSGGGCSAGGTAPASPAPLLALGAFLALAAGLRRRRI
jgi:uncharacterized protein (TIGR03382 family)